MKTYLVGGAVRDKLLGLPVKEKDWVVVGATPDEMLAKGFKQVGNSFPVFLHPQSNEEYALARLERKTAPGYRGFEFDASKKVTLEEDLQRRDLTINAIAEDENGQLIDPYRGQQDIKAKVLRHVSSAFSEDPVRILRIARFAARFSELGFTVAHETNILMKKMVETGEVDALVAERVWQELEKALREKNPQQFFIVLQNCEALVKIFPEEEELQTGLSALEYAVQLSEDAAVRFAAWLCHLGDEKIKNICERLKSPKEYRELALLTTGHLDAYKNAVQLPPPAILDILKALDGFRRFERFEKFLLAAEAVLRAMPGNQHKPQPQGEYLRTALNCAKAVTASSITNKRLEGEALAQELDVHRRAAISRIKRTYHWSKFD